MIIDFTVVHYITKPVNGAALSSRHLNLVIRKYASYKFFFQCLTIEPVDVVLCFNPFPTKSAIWHKMQL